MGSSPLSRGILLGGDPEIFKGRIIPALAGNTSMAMVGDIWKPDHPRSRGEYAEMSQPGFVKGGSSPLSRGILVWGSRKYAAPGIIPALAGNTPYPWHHRS